MENSLSLFFFTVRVERVNTEIFFTQRRGYITFIKWQIATRTRICITRRSISVRVLSLIQMLIQIRFTFHLEKPLHVLSWTIPYQSLQGRAIPLLVPRRLAVTALNLQQCDGSLKLFSLFTAIQRETRFDGGCQTSRSFGIYYSKTIQQDVGEYAVI